MSQVRSAQTPFQMRKRSFDLAWGAWAGILAVMTAVGAAFAGSQILLMYPRPVKMIEFKYPSLPKADSDAQEQLDENTPAIFWSKDGYVFGRLSDLIAPVKSRELVIKNGPQSKLGESLSEIQEWCKRNLTGPVRYIALGQSQKSDAMNFAQVSEVVNMFEKINSNVFSQNGVVPSVVSVELANPL